MKLDKVRQESRSKDESLRKIEESCQNLENKIRGKEQLCRNLQEKVFHIVYENHFIIYSLLLVNLQFLYPIFFKNKELEGQLDSKMELQSLSEKQYGQLSEKLKVKEEACISLQQKV